MNLGPSLTLAPFTYINVPALHYIQMNVYYHIGYHASILMMKNNDEFDANPGNDTTDEELKDEMGDHAVLDFGHGMTTSFGCSLSWKFIGVGFETRNDKLEYKSLSESDFGKDKYKFKSTLNRIYLQFRF